jgi:hypothetical protein
MFDCEDHVTAKTNNAKTATAAKPATKRAATTKSRTKRRKPSHGEIAERAYYIHLDENERDELGNWLRAERELTAA